MGGGAGQAVGSLTVSTCGCAARPAAASAWLRARPAAASGRLRVRVGLRWCGFNSSCAPKGPRPGGWQRRRLGFSGCGSHRTQESVFARAIGGSATAGALVRLQIHRRAGQAWQRCFLLVDRSTRREKRCPPHPKRHPRFFICAFEVERFCVGDAIPWQTQHPWPSDARTQNVASNEGHGPRTQPTSPPAARSRPFRSPSPSVSRGSAPPSPDPPRQRTSTTRPPRQRTSKTRPPRQRTSKTRPPRQRTSTTRPPAAAHPQDDAQPNPRDVTSCGTAPT